MRLAQLPWYDFSFLRSAHDRLWQALRLTLDGEGVCGLPPALSDSGDLDQILFSPKLLFSQTCGYDIAVRRPLKVIATPSYKAPGCGRGTYRSWIVVRRDSAFLDMTHLDGARFVANDERSWSGYHCMRRYFPRFTEIKFSGGHCKSLEFLRAGRADVAALDCIVWELLRQQQPDELKEFRVVGKTEEALAPPLVTSAAISDSELLALRNGFRRLPLGESSRGICEQLLIQDFVVLGTQGYASMADEPFANTAKL